MQLEINWNLNCLISAILYSQLSKDIFTIMKNTLRNEVFYLTSNDPPPLANSEKAEECGEHCGSLMFPVVPLNPYTIGPIDGSLATPFITIPKYGDFQGNSQFSPHHQSPSDKGKNVVSRTEQRSSCPTSLVW